jgi:hypothetical protein
MFVFTHQIAGITFRTESDVLLSSLQKYHFEKFRVGDAIEPDVRCRFRRVDPDSLTLPPLSAEERKRLYRYVLHPQGSPESPLLRSPVVRARLQAGLNQSEGVGLSLRHTTATIFDFARRELDTFYTPDQRDFLADCYVGPGIFAVFLPTFSAAMVHSSSLIRNDAAALFLAPDEGGKTTVVKHSTASTILGDDQIILRKEGDAFMAHGTPWGLIANSFQQARVGGFFLLEQAERFELIPLKPVDALKHLWNEHLVYRLFLPRHLMVRAFEILYEACRQAPVYRMRFPKDCVDWDAIDAAMAR